jgi:hypothetical protein
MPLTEKEREYQRLHKQRIRQDFIDSRGGGCEWCGVVPEAYGLIVDYADLANKPGWAAKIWRMAKERRDAELAKCIVLCKECYLKHTEPAHGTYERYRRPGDPCRCPACQKANADRGYMELRKKNGPSKRPRKFYNTEPMAPPTQATAHVWGIPQDEIPVPGTGWWQELGHDTLSEAPNQIAKPKD